MREVWRDIPGLKYEASTGGEVRRHGKIAALTPTPNRDSGYLYVSIRDAGKSRKRRLHCLIALAFLGPCPDGHQVNHIDGNKANCRPDNLEYMTGPQNMRHAKETGLMPHGERAGGAKLTEQDVRQIVELKASGTTIREIGKRFNVAHSVVQKIVSGRSWQHLGLVPAQAAWGLRRTPLSDSKTGSGR